MKALLVYWVAGCLLAGLAAGSRIKDCPRDEVSMSEMLMVVAVWPSFLFAGFTAPSHIPKSPCKIT